MLNTPVLFLVFNRPDLTKQVFEVIREVKPKQLFIAADGPRLGNNNDIEKCQQVREILKQVDWECKLTTLFRESNMGCKLAVSSAIDWFFKNVEEGIILEDDTLPDSSFFQFCEQLLEYYRYDERIMMISGYNVCEKWNENIQQYHFSFFGSIWGWASWKRAWKHYDVKIKLWEDKNIQQLIGMYFTTEQFEIRKKVYDDLYNGKIDTWDLQWTFCKLLNSGINIIPSLNLIENIGFGPEGTHTSSYKPKWASYKRFSLKNIKIRENVLIVDKKYDDIHLSLSMPNNLKLREKKIVKRIVLKFLNAFKLKSKFAKKTNKDSAINKPSYLNYEVTLPKNIKFIGSKKPIIEIDKGTYYNGLDIYCWDETIKISIGKYCSIADQVKFIAGGEHDKDWVSSYPFINVWDVNSLKHLLKARYKGHISIGNDVWIGNNVVVLSGVTVGDGAAIGAGCVVTKNVPAYSVFAGNPGKVVKMRFEDWQIEELKKIKWWNWSESKIFENLELFTDINKFIKTHTFL